MNWPKHFVKTFRCFASKIAELEKRGGEWVYRGQRAGWNLESSLERTCKKWDFPTANIHIVEAELIREFQRGYSGSDLHLVQDDICYCLSLMRHHGAPCRLLDWTYSPFVAARFALDYRDPAEGSSPKQDGVVWCLNTDWLHEQAGKSVPQRALTQWDRRRDDRSFRQLFMPKGTRKKFVYTANPFSLNERLQAQQGLFLCQGDISVSFEKNLPAEHEHGENILQLKLDLEGDALQCFGRYLMRMNVSSASLYPGLDGYAKSLGERLFSRPPK
jgi:hypothetical protein